MKDPSGPIWRTKGHLVMKGLSKNMDFDETHYSVRQKIGDPGSISTQNMFPFSSVVPKRLELSYGATKKKQIGRKSSCSVSPLAISLRTTCGAEKLRDLEYS